MIGLMEPEICTEMLKKLSEKVGAKCPATTHGYSMVICPSQRRFLGSFFNCKQAQQKANHCSKKEKKRRKRKSEKKMSKIEKLKDVGPFLVQKLKILISAHARTKMS